MIKRVIKGPGRSLVVGGMGGLLFILILGIAMLIKACDRVSDRTICHELTKHQQNYQTEFLQCLKTLKEIEQEK
jgi:hypothetical protein